MKEEIIINNIVNNFYKISKIYRPSHNEKEISNYLKEWSIEKNIKVEQDKFYNLKLDIEPTKGFENQPLFILQAHLDMVLAIKDKTKFNKENPIKIIKQNNTLKAENTSLGADDGIGIAIIMSIIENMNHGPLRVIFTVDEEDTMTGVFNINKEWLKDAKYLINIDNELSTEVLVSTASGDSIKVIDKKTFIDPKNNLSINIELYNFKGGHSGMEINKNRLNGIIVLVKFLELLNELNINYELSSFNGGIQSNAIPTNSNVDIIINNKDKELIEHKLKEYINKLIEQYKEEIKYNIKENNIINKVLTNEDKNNFIKYITNIINGVYTMSKDIEGLVESSSNLGVVKLNENEVLIHSMIRSSNYSKEEEIINQQLNLAKECNLKSNFYKISDAWPFDKNSELLEIIKKVYKKQNNKEINVVSVHAGVECGTFKKYKPDLDMISIGPDLINVHTINETLYLDSIPRVWNLIEGVLLWKK